MSLLFVFCHLPRSPSSHTHIHFLSTKPFTYYFYSISLFNKYFLSNYLCQVLGLGAEDRSRNCRVDGGENRGKQIIRESSFSHNSGVLQTGSGPTLSSCNSHVGWIFYFRMLKLVCIHGPFTAFLGSNLSCNFLGRHYSPWL
jgi:hypothetical protein